MGVRSVPLVPQPHAPLDRALLAYCALVALALLAVMASSDPAAAATQLEGGWGARLTAEENNWAWVSSGHSSQASSRRVARPCP